MRENPVSPAVAASGCRPRPDQFPAPEPVELAHTGADFRERISAEHRFDQSDENKALGGSLFCKGCQSIHRARGKGWNAAFRSFVQSLSRCKPPRSRSRCSMDRLRSSLAESRTKGNLVQQSTILRRDRQDFLDLLGGHRAPPRSGRRVKAANSLQRIFLQITAGFGRAPPTKRPSEST